MKKLLTLLLTLVMAVCLVNQKNNNNTKAEDNGSNYYYSYGDGSWGETPQASFNATDVIQITNTGSGEIYLYKNGDTTPETIYPGATITHTVSYTGASITSSGSNITIKDKDQYFVCNNTTHTCTMYSTIYRKSGKWTWDNEGNINVLTEDVTQLGLSVNAGEDEYSFSKNLNVGGTNKQPIDFELNKSITINLIGDLNEISFLGSSTNTTTFPIYFPNVGQYTVTINGNGKTFKLDNPAYMGLEIDGDVGKNSGIELILKNVNLIGGELYISWFNTAKLTTKDDAVLDIYNDWTGLAIEGASTLNLQDGYEIKGSTDGVNYSDVEHDYTDGSFKIKGTSNNATYTVIRKKNTPAPSEPVVKDESCEKVIGPTWHWNNTKGICEDYGVVGTSTR